MHSREFNRRMAMSLLAAACIGWGHVRGRVSTEANGPQTGKLPRSVILITIGTLRADHTGCLGYKRDTTPNLDAVAKENTLFRNAFATSGWMMPTHGSIFTSLYPGIHGATHIDKRLADASETLAEVLHKNGYYCAGFCCGPRLDQEHGFAQGFDLYDDYSVAMALDGLAFGAEQKADINKRRTNDLINDAAIGWLRNNKHQPFFMFVHYYDNHWDYLPPAPYNQMYDPQYKGTIDGTEIAREPLFSNPPSEQDIEHIIALYDGEVRQTDTDLGEMIRYLKDSRTWDNSVVIILADHGEQFYEHGHTSHHGVYEELIHIPLVVSIAGTPAKGNRIDSLVSQLDVMPTILDYLEMPIPGACKGKSMRPLLEGGAETINDFVFTEYTGGAAPDTYAVRSARYKYYQSANVEPSAYDLAKDPAERNRILPDGFTPEIKTLQKHLQTLMESNNYERK